MKQPVLLPLKEPAPPLQPHHTRVFCTKHLRTDLGRRAVRGAASISLGQGSQFVINLVTTGILARLLTPEDFGLVAMTAVITSFMLVFKDAGLTSATIQRENLTHEQASTLFWVNACTGVLIAAVLGVAAPWIAAGFGEARLTLITQVLGISFILGGLTVQHQALLRRQMRFKSLAARGVVASVVGAATGISLAWGGAGYWALVAMALANAFTNMIAVWLAIRWMPGPPRRAAGTRHLLRFGGDILISDLAAFFSRKVDSLLIGWFWGPVALGLYDKAYTLLLAPVKQINRPMAAVFVPTLSRLSNEDAVRRRYFLHGLESVASVSVPIILAIAVFADELVLLWLGPQWMECAHLFRLMAIAALAGAVSTPLGWLQVSAGHTRRYRRIAVMTAIVLVTCFSAGIAGGAQGVAIAYSAGTLLLAVPVWHHGLKGSPVSLLDAARAVAVPLASGVPAAGVSWFAMRLLGVDVSPWIRTLAGLLTFACVYAGFLLVAFGRLAHLKEALHTMRRARKTDTPTPAEPLTPS